MAEHEIPEVDDEFLQRLLAEICRGPIGEAMMAVAKGERQVVIKQHPSKSGWVVTTEVVEREDGGQSPLRAAAVDHGHQVGTSSSQ